MENKIQMFWVLFFGGICIAKSTFAAKILIIHPMYSKSHDNFNGGIVRSLLSAGHHVTSISAFPESIKHVNHTAIDCNVHQNTSDFTNIISVSAAQEMSKAMFSYLSVFMEDAISECRKVIGLSEVQKILQAKTKLFDVLILDTALSVSECFIPFADKFGIPVIGTLCLRFWLKIDWQIGNPFSPAVLLSEYSSHSYPMTFFQRLENTWLCLVELMFHKYFTISESEKFYQEHFPDLNFADRKKISLLFTNNHPALIQRPVLPTVVNIGGIHVQPVKPLPKNLQTFIDGAKHGVILFSIGSLLQSHNMPPELLSVFRETFARIPQRVIWKTEGHIESLSENVMLSKWLPLRDILAHPNIVAFIYHCGISGVYEALHSGKPMVLMPVFGDQLSNAAFLQQLGVGPKININNLTKEQLLETLNDVINKTKYREQMKDVSNLMKDLPMSASETVVYWTEYVIRHNGAEHLQSAGLEIPLYQYLLLDIIGFIVSIILVTFILLYLILKNVYKCICNKIMYSPKQKMN